METSKLVLEFASTTGTKKYTLNYANPEALSTAVKALMTAYINATALFDVTLTAPVAAYLVTTTREEYDLD